MKSYVSNITKYCINRTMNIDEFNLYGICIGRRYNIRILYKGGYSVHTTTIKHDDSCNSYVPNIMIVQRDSPNRRHVDSNSIHGISVY